MVEEVKNPGDVVSNVVPVSPRAIPPIKKILTKKQKEYIKILIVDFKKDFPRAMIPNKYTGWVFAGIFIFVVIIGIFQFPMGDITSFEEGSAVGVGIPFHFLVFSFGLDDKASMPLRISGLIWDLLIYLGISYAINVAINVIMQSDLFRDKIKKKDKPRVYNVRQGVVKKVKPIVNSAAIPVRKV